VARQKLTRWIIAKIPAWLEQGLRADEIAQNAGVTVGTLRVRCSQLKISLKSGNQQNRRLSPQRSGILNARLDGQDYSDDVANPLSTIQRLVISVPPETAKMLAQRAALKGLSRVNLAAALLEKIALDDLYDAVLDE
jgi:hypothetical protein